MVVSSFQKLKMETFPAFLIILFSGGVCSHNPYGSLSEHIMMKCNSDDLICLRKSLEKFLETTHLGLPILNIEPIDPITIPALYVDGGNINARNKLTNVVVKGFKQTFLSNLKVNKVSKIMELSTLPLLNMIGDVTVFMGSSGMEYVGTFNLTGSAFAKISFNYKVNTHNDGTQHLEAGPETINCNTMKVPDLGLNPELMQFLEVDEYVKTISKQRRAALRSKVFCEVLKEVIKVGMSNIRKVNKILPVSAIFKDRI